MLSFSFSPKAISLTITSTATFDPPKCIVPMSNRYDRSTFVKQIGGKPTLCTSIEQLQQAWMNVCNNLGYGGLAHVAIHGTLGDDNINKEFNNLNDVKTFFQQNGFNVLTMDEFLEIENEKLSAEHKSRLARP